MAQNDVIEEMFGKIIDALETNRVPYMIFGGLAAGVWGDPRYTDDVDVVIALHEKEMVRVLRSLSGEGFGVDEDIVIQNLQISGVARIEYKGYFADFLIGESDFEKTAFTRKKRSRIFGREVDIVSSEDLLIYKIFAGRPHDLEDARRIMIRQGATIDLHYIDHWSRWLSNRLGNPAIEQRWIALRDKPIE